MKLFMLIDKDGKTLYSSQVEGGNEERLAVSLATRFETAKYYVVFAVDIPDTLPTDDKFGVIETEFNLLEIPSLESLGEVQTCPRRMIEMGPWKREENLDYWERTGPDRVCSFCGSLHPDEFIVVLKDAADPESKTWIEQSDKSYKVYVRREGITNASAGAIKYYKHHNLLTPGEDGFEEVSELFTRAVSVSRVKWNRKFQEIRSEIHGNG